MIPYTLVYIVTSFIVSCLIYLGTYYFLISDFLRDLTGYTLFYKNDGGHKKISDHGMIFLYNIIVPLIFTANIWAMYFFVKLDFLFYGGLIYLLINIYFTVLLVIRLKYFFYKDEERDMRKRDSFKNYKDNMDMLMDCILDKNNSQEIVRDHSSYGCWSAMIVSLTLFVYLFLYLYSGFSYLIYVIILLVGFMHLMLFPDYLNKIYPYDIRTRKGFQLTYKLLSLIYLLGGYIIKMYIM